MFYEEVATCPPFYLRRLLPIPIRSDGCKFEIGAEVKCSYTNGYLLKRVARITRRRNFGFEVVRQELGLIGRIRVLGGDYTLRPLSKDQTRVSLTTRYASPNRPRWLFRRLEAAICHSFHRHILKGMQRSLSQS